MLTRSSADHIELLDALDEYPGPVILSGYDNDLYNGAHQNRSYLDQSSGS
ncbi:hypothetical protein EMIT07CA2_30437 [Brevibacillus sp. IT-7CA2]